MKKTIGFTALIIIILVLWSCSKDSTPTTPPVPQIPNCEKFSTATVYFENRHASWTVDVIWDGIYKTTIGPGQKSSTFTEASGKHSMWFRLSNTGWPVTNLAEPVLAQCGDYFYYCQ